MSDYDEILIALRRITRAIDIHSKRLVKSSGLTAPQLVVLQSLRQRGELAPSAIARAVSLSQATVTSILDRLEAQKLVERRRSESDRRRRRRARLNCCRPDFCGRFGNCPAGSSTC
jgi:DNA-binding MarR family transcriptional regulator